MLEGMKLKNLCIFLAVFFIALSCGTVPNLAAGRRGSKSKKVVYYLPLEYGDTRKIFQGNNQGPTHNDRYNFFAFDFSPMPVGTPVTAAADGVVSFVKEDTAGPTGNWRDNNLVAIRHAGGIVSEYLHLKRNGAAVVVGRKVKAGDLIGYSGNTGNSGGPHLHFGLKKGSHLGESVPCSFEDVLGNGVPKRGDVVTSKNFPVRFRVECDLIERTAVLYGFCNATGCLEAISKDIKSVSKIKIDMPLKVLKEAVKKRDGIIESYEKAAEVALAALKKARDEKDMKTAVRLAYFGSRDFACSKKAKDFKAALSAMSKEEGYKDAMSGLSDEKKYRKKMAQAIKKELKLKAKKKKKTSYSSVIKLYEQALPNAPNNEAAERLKKHIEELKAG
jgi:hypothetical protein